MLVLLALTTGLFFGIIVGFAALAVYYEEKIAKVIKNNTDQLEINSELLEHFEIIMTKKDKD